MNPEDNGRMPFLTLSSFNHDRFAEAGDHGKGAADILRKHGLVERKSPGRLTVDMGSLEERKIFALMEDLRRNTGYMLLQLTEKDPNAVEPANEKERPAEA